MSFLSTVRYAWRKNFGRPDPWYRIWRMAHNVGSDILSSGRILTSTDAYTDAKTGASGNLAEGTDYAVLDGLSPYFRFREDDVIVDVGCGLGRTLLWWNRQGFRQRMIGIEINPRVAAVAKKVLSRYANVEILTGDAAQILPAEGTFFYLFNPLSASDVAKFRDLLREYAKDGKKRTVLYNYPVHGDLFDPSEWHIERVVNLRSRLHRPALVLRPRFGDR